MWNIRSNGKVILTIDLFNVFLLIWGTKHKVVYMHKIHIIVPEFHLWLKLSIKTKHSPLIIWSNPQYHVVVDHVAFNVVHSQGQGIVFTWHGRPWSSALSLDVVLHDDIQHPEVSMFNCLIVVSVGYNRDHNEAWETMIKCFIIRCCITWWYTTSGSINV